MRPIGQKSPDREQIVLNFPLGSSMAKIAEEVKKTVDAIPRVNAYVSRTPLSDAKDDLGDGKAPATPDVEQQGLDDRAERIAHFLNLELVIIEAPREDRPCRYLFREID